MFAMFSPVMDWLDGLGAWGTGIKALLGVAIGAFGIISSLKSIAIVPRGHTGYKERNGEPVRYNRGYKNVPKEDRPCKTYHGFNLLLPWIDSMREVDNLEQIREPEMIERSVNEFVTKQAKATFTFQIIDGFPFLYRHNDPLAEIENEFISYIQSLLEDDEWVLNEAATVSICHYLDTFAMKYGVTITNVKKIMWKLEAGMAQAQAQNNIAKAIRLLARRADLYSRLLDAMHEPATAA